MHRAKLLLFALLLVLPVIGWVAAVHAQEFHSGNSVNLPPGKIVNSTVFAAGRSVNIAGVINGDVFCAGQDVTVSAQVRGDVICSGQNVTVSGNVTGDVRLLGQDVKLGGSVSGNATVAAQTFVEQPEASVRGDVTLGAQDGTIHGTVGRDLSASTSTLTVSSTVSRNIQAVVQNLHLDTGARIGGNVDYTSGNTLQRSGGAQVSGHVTKHAPSPSHPGRKSIWSYALYVYLAGLLTALVLVLLLPRMFEYAARLARGSLARTFLVGVVASIVWPVVIVILAVTLVGIPLAVILGLALLLALFLSGPYAAYVFSRSLVRGEANAILIMLVGAGILFFGFLLPFIGWLIWLIAMWIGLGAIVLSVLGVGRPRYNVGSLPPKAKKTPEPTPAS